MTLNVQDATNEANHAKLASWLTSLVKVAEIDKEQNYKRTVTKPISRYEWRKKG